MKGSRAQLARYRDFGKQTLDETQDELKPRPKSAATRLEYALEGLSAYLTQFDLDPVQGMVQTVWGLVLMLLWYRQYGRWRAHYQWPAPAYFGQHDDQHDIFPLRLSMSINIPPPPPPKHPYTPPADIKKIQSIYTELKARLHETDEKRYGVKRGMCNATLRLIADAI